MQLGVTGALELLEDHLVGLGPGVDEGGTEDGQRSALLDVASGAEELLGLDESLGVDAARSDLAGGGHGVVVAAGQPRDRVEQDDHVVAALDHAPGFFHDHLRHLDVADRLLVEGRGHDLHRLGGVAAEVGHLLGPLVDEEHDDVHLRMVGGDGVGDLLEDDRLAGPGRGDDQGSLPEAEGRHQIDDPRLEHRGLGLERDAIVGMERCEVLEGWKVVQEGRIAIVHLLHSQEGKVGLRLLGGTDQAPHDLALAEAEAPNLRGADVDVVGRGKVGVLGAPQEAEAVRQNRERPLAHGQALSAGPGLEDLEDELLLGQRGEVLDLLFLGDLGQLLGRHPLKRREAQIVFLGQFVPALRLLVDRRRFGFELRVAGHLAGLEGDGQRGVHGGTLLVAPLAVFSRGHALTLLLVIERGGGLSNGALGSLGTVHAGTKGGWSG